MSGIYIPRMEMPSQCCDCKMYVEDIYCCHLLHREIENPWADDGVELDCPLAPVPPHGRLIDADALIKELTLDDEDDNSGASLLMAIFLEVLKAAPTIIPAEEE